MAGCDAKSNGHRHGNIPSPHCISFAVVLHKSFVDCKVDAVAIELSCHGNPLSFIYPSQTVRTINRFDRVEGSIVERGRKGCLRLQAYVIDSFSGRGG